MDRKRLVYIDYSDWCFDELRSNGRIPKDETDDDRAHRPRPLYALDDKGRFLTAAHYAGCLHVIASSATGVSVLLDTAIAVEYATCETDAGDWLFQDERFDKSLLSSSKA